MNKPVTTYKSQPNHKGKIFTSDERVHSVPRMAPLTFFTTLERHIPDIHLLLNGCEPEDWPHFHWFRKRKERPTDSKMFAHEITTIFPLGADEHARDASDQILVHLFQKQGDTWFINPFYVINYSSVELGLWELLVDPEQVIKEPANGQ